MEGAVAVDGGEVVCPQLCEWIRGFCLVTFQVAEKEWLSGMFLNQHQHQKIRIPEPSNVPGKNKQLRFVPFLGVAGKTFVFFWNARILGFHWFQGISIYPSPIPIAILAVLGDWKLRRLQFKAHWRAHVYACVYWCTLCFSTQSLGSSPVQVAWLGNGVFDIIQAWQLAEGRHERLRFDNAPISQMDGLLCQFEALGLWKPT